jgi:hypothetical protein
MYQIGDKVKINFEENENYGKVGEIGDILNYPRHQFARVYFSSSMFDYVDVGSWKLVKIGIDG